MEKRAAPGQKGGRKIDAVLDGATRVFLERGYATASMNDVAAAAAVSKRTLYQYFTSKEALFAAVVQGRTRAIIDHLEAGVGTRTDEAPSLFLLGMTIVNHMLLPDTARFLRMVTAEADRWPELGRVLDHTAFAQVLAEVERALVRAVEAQGGHLEDSAFAAELFVSMMWGLQLLRSLVGSGSGTAPNDGLCGDAETIARKVAFFARAIGLADSTKKSTKAPPKAGPKARSRRSQIAPPR